MTTTKPRSRILRLLLGLFLAAPGCAVSPADTLEAPSFRSNDESAAKADAGLADEVDAAQQDKRDAGSGSAERDAGATPLGPPADGTEADMVDDEPVEVPDETTMEPGPEVPAAPAAAEPEGAGDAQARPVDAAANVVDASVAPLQPEAGLPPGTCKQATDCTQQCVPVGILHCCRDDGRCGCTWAPGAYCL